ncbi:MAG: hypothetical protein PHP79_10375 [Clostridia bacterium]|nr:hypothetical protein [Clostridia bacterium]
MNNETLCRSYLNGDESGLKLLMERHGSNLNLEGQKKQEDSKGRAD